MVHFLTVDEQKEWVKKATYVEREKASDQENKRKKENRRQGKRIRKGRHRNKRSGGAAISQWIRLPLPSYRPRFESQAHHLCFHLFIVLCNVEKTKINKKRPGLAHLIRL